MPSPVCGCRGLLATWACPQNKGDKWSSRRARCAGRWPPSGRLVLGLVGFQWSNILTPCLLYTSPSPRD
eukprot:13667097-Alexandrium_andersonii.AAC.1